jgi:hypothetical protein
MELRMPLITLDQGIKITTFQPPPGFNPLTASPEDVVKNGFPTRPEDPHHLERYKHVFRQLNGKFHYVEPTFRVNSERRHGPRMRRPQDGTETSTNWSGGVVYAPSGQSFKWVEGDWVVPNVDAKTNGITVRVGLASTAIKPRMFAKRASNVKCTRAAAR